MAIAVRNLTIRIVSARLVDSRLSLKKAYRKSTITRRHKSSLQTTQDFKMNLFVSCLPGLEPLLSAELDSLQIPHSPTAGGANLRNASHDQLLQCHLYLGTASHVLWQCGRAFEARKFAELRKKVAKLKWGDWLMKDAHIDIRVTCTKSKLFHTSAVAERVKAAIYESLGREEEEEEAPEKSNNDLLIDTDKMVRLTVRIVKDMVVISIDTSSTPLHRRGYRLETAKAPLREDLAFALLMVSGWQQQYDGRQDLKFGGLLDPFCGSGTIVIEGASMMAGLPPGRLRPAPLGGTQLFDPLRWKTLLDDKVRLEPHSDVIICGSDRDAGAVSAAIANAERAGVRELIDFRNAALTSNPWFEDPLLAPNYPLVVTNPPFGKRIKGKDSKRDIHPLLPLYQTLGGRMSKLIEAKPGAAITVLAHDLKLARRMGLPSIHVAFSTHHGGIDVSAMTSVSGEATRMQKGADLTRVLT